jgi:hypothetical protein
MSSLVDVKAANGNMEVRVLRAYFKSRDEDGGLERQTERTHVWFRCQQRGPKLAGAESESSTKTPESNSSSGPIQTPRSTSGFVRSHLVVKEVDHVSLKAQKIKARLETSKVW